jgi:hypothetical protein
MVMGRLAVLSWVLRKVADASDRAYTSGVKHQGLHTTLISGTSVCPVQAKKELRSPGRPAEFVRIGGGKLVPIQLRARVRAECSVARADHRVAARMGVLGVSNSTLLTDSKRLSSK